jgi:hypothetical protein
MIKEELMAVIQVRDLAYCSGLLSANFETQPLMSINYY